MTIFRYGLGVCVSCSVPWVHAQNTPQPLTPPELIEQVRAQQAALGRIPDPTTPVVPAPPASLSSTAADVPDPIPTAHRHTPTWQDKRRLEAQLRVVNDALKIQDTTEDNTQHPEDTVSVKAKMLFTYTDGGVYQVQAATFHETAIELQPGETLTGKELPTAGDTTRWTLAATRAGTAPNEITVLIVKPLEPYLETNMTITTNRRIYNVILQSSEHVYMPLVGWLYPQDEAEAVRQKDELDKQIETLSEPLKVQPDQLNFSCTVAGSNVAWRPLRVYDDGAKTYLQMSPAMQTDEAPALFVLEDKQALLVNYRVKHSIYIVDRLFERAQLKIGPKATVDIRCPRPTAS